MPTFLGSLSKVALDKIEERCDEEIAYTYMIEAELLVVRENELTDQFTIRKNSVFLAELSTAFYGVTTAHLTWDLAALLAPGNVLSLGAMAIGVIASAYNVFDRAAVVTKTKTTERLNEVLDRRLDLMIYRLRVRNITHFRQQNMPIPPWEIRDDLLL